MTDRTRFYRNVLIKGLILFAVANALCAAVDRLPFLGRISIYNRLVPGRVRLPYGEDPAADYNLSLFNLEAMFASHEVNGPAAPGEYRVMLIGDSSTWGFLLRPEETLAERINRNESGRLHVYNLGYPTMSATKDLLLLKYAMSYRPDLIVWMVTLESLPQSKQLASPILQQNAAAVRAYAGAAALRSSTSAMYRRVAAGSAFQIRSAISPPRTANGTRKTGHQNHPAFDMMKPRLIDCRPLPR